MDRAEIAAMLADFSSLPSHPRDAELALVEAALFVEQAFGLPLSEAEISEDNLGSPAALERFVMARIGGR